jgi:hypothetical protein
MNSKNASLLSRRQFARRAALLSATATITPVDALLPAASSAQTQPSTTQLSPEGQLEADSRYQQVISLYGDRLDDVQKANIKKMCADLQPTLERIRKFDLQNGNAPALYLKPLVERDKKSSSPAATKNLNRSREC